MPAVQAFNKWLHIGNIVGRVPVLSTVGVAVIRIPTAIIAVISCIVAKNLGLPKQRVDDFKAIAVFNFMAIFGEIIPGLNMLFHLKVYGGNSHKLPSLRTL